MKREISALILPNTEKNMEHKGNGDTIVIGALGTIPKDFRMGLEDLEFREVENIQTTRLVISATIPRRVLET